jgi:hypothetical protein
MYELALTVHSVLRLALLLLVILILFSALRGLFGNVPRPMGAGLLHRVAVICADLQLTIGLLLYFVWSPQTSSAMQNMGAAMKDKDLRFWAVEHGTLMLLSIIFVHVGKILAKRAGSDRSFHVRSALWFGLALAGILLGAPGTPWSEHGRSFLRL